MKPGQFNDAFRRCLIELDVIGVCELWFKVAPHLPQPRTNEDALRTLHHARTVAESIPEKLRLYSHSWLTERGLPSGLPDPLRPKAERTYPITVEAVGVSVNALSEAGRVRAKFIEREMSNAVMECYADGVKDPEKIKLRMAEARAKAEAQ